MTREEREAAIAYIKNYRKLDEDLHNNAPKDSISYYATDKCLKYWDMAIQTLSSWEEYSDKLWKEAYERGKTEALSQEPCDDTVSIRKDVLKCRVGELVAYNVEWLKKHWQMEMDIVCGVKPCDDAISRKDIQDYIAKYLSQYLYEDVRQAVEVIDAYIGDMPSVTHKSGKWIPVSERLPEDIKPVIVTWKNTDPESYYQYIVGKHFIGTAHYKSGKWYWYSSVTEDLLAVYGKCDSEEFDEAIEVVAWMPLPEPYEPQESEDKG